MRVWSAAAVIAAILIIGFVLSVPEVRDLGATKPAALQASSTPMVYIHDVYKKGVHTITAELALPDACTTVSGEADVTPSATPDSTSSPQAPDTINLALDMPSDSGICLEEPATTTLSYTATASAGATITATINGNNASTTSY
jgi:hypothetical protein